MSHLVSSVSPISGAHVVKLYAGFGILGADIPTTGDNGGSPVLNDSTNPAAEYHWRVETPPDSGTLTIYPDLSYTLEGAADGSHPWVYHLFENGVSQGTATVNDQFGAVTQLVTLANSQQSNHATSVAIRQTHKVGIASSQQSNVDSPASVSQSSTTFVAGSNSQQVNHASPVAIRQTHRIGIANSQQVNRCSSIRVSDGSVQAPNLTSHPHYIIKAPARRFIISK